MRSRALAHIKSAAKILLFFDMTKYFGIFFHFSSISIPNARLYPMVILWPFCKSSIIILQSSIHQYNILFFSTNLREWYETNTRQIRDIYESKILNSLTFSHLQAFLQQAKSASRWFLNSYDFVFCSFCLKWSKITFFL